MTWTSKYLEESLFYEPWKTKFIEVFCREYVILKHNIRTNSGNLNDNIEHFISIFATMLKILKKKLLAEGNDNTVFYSDVLCEAYKQGLILNLKLCYEIMFFINKCHANKDYYKNFKSEYLNVFEDLMIVFKPLVKNSGFREKDYVIYDNTYCLWGLEEKYYKKIIRLFLTFENLKIVRICGSRVTQDYREFSDIDLISEGTYSQKEYYKMLDKIYKLDIPYIIDMNDIYKNSKPFIYRNTVRSNVFYQRSDYYKDDYEQLFK